MQQPKLINTPEAFNKVIDIISGQPHLAVDSETNSFFAYRPRTCLIQISCDRGDFIVDPLALEDLSALGSILGDPAVEKILHAAENDLIGLKRDFRFNVRNVFDTAIAYGLLGRKRLGLARILSEECGVQVDKKLQRCDWERRPLRTDQLYYAQLDTHFLIELRHGLHRQLLEADRWALAQERFAQLESFRPRPKKAWNPYGYLYLKGTEELSLSSIRALKALYSYREHLARKVNKAPFRIMNNDFMVRLARAMPNDHPALLRVRGLPAHFRGKKAGKLLRIIRESES